MAEEVHAVLERCGVVAEATRNNIITCEGFMQLADFGVLENDTDVSEMAKRMALRMVAEGRVLLGTVIVKCLQTLVWWMRDHQKRGLPLEAADFDIETMNKVAQMKVLSRELADKEPSVKELGKFDPDDFDAYEDTFLNLLAQL
jgi:hypothetical protein